MPDAPPAASSQPNRAIDTFLHTTRNSRHTKSEATSIAADSSAGRKKHKVFGIKPTQAKRVSNPHSYEQKYSEDEAYTEMGPTARIWKVFLDESARIDTQMVEDWRDALDVLLVFASLFSAVVTTFVSQTYQALQPDYNQLTAARVAEVADLIRAAVTGGADAVQAVPPIATPSTPFEADLTSSWVNGMWFTSLALSLTTTLIAVLAKQWIQQYMSLPSGSPSERCRIRQVRFINLHTWHVPVIIGLLPVLMHLSLGFFCAGLIIFVRSVNIDMSYTLIGVFGGATLVYFVANLLPLFKLDCPYKTPLTLYIHQTMGRLFWPRLRRALHCLLAGITFGETPDQDSDGFASLQDLEKERIAHNGNVIDVDCLSWLYTISSDCSVLGVVLQAVSNLPLQSATAITRDIVGIQDALLHALHTAGSHLPESVSTYERLSRAIVKLEPLHEFDDLRVPAARPGGPFPLLAIKEHADDAVTFLKSQLFEQSAKLDVLCWALILRNAFRTGTNWLEVNRDDSEIWSLLLSWVVREHQCLLIRCNPTRNVCATIPVPLSAGSDDLCAIKLEILDLPGTELPINILTAIREFMFPSFCDILWTISCRPSQLGLTRLQSDIPNDIRLQLDLMQLYIHRGLHSEGSSEKSMGGGTVSRIVQCVHSYLEINRDNNNLRTLHPDLVLACHHAVCRILTIDDSLWAVMPYQTKRDLLHAMFRSVRLKSNLRDMFLGTLTPALRTRIHEVAFPASEPLPFPLLLEMLEYDTSVGDGMFVPSLYGSLTARQWIREVESEVVLHSGRQPPAWWCLYSHFLPLYIEGLAILKHAHPQNYKATLEYLRRPSTLETLSKHLLLTNDDARPSLRTLASLAGIETWTACVASLRDLLRTEVAAEICNHCHAGTSRQQSPLNVQAAPRQLEDILLDSITFLGGSKVENAAAASSSS